MKHALCTALLLGFALAESAERNGGGPGAEGREGTEGGIREVAGAQKAYDDLKTAAVRKYAGPEESRAFRAC